MPKQGVSLKNLKNELENLMKRLFESVIEFSKNTAKSELFPWTEAAIGVIGLAETAATVLYPTANLIKALESFPFSVPGLIKIMTEFNYSPLAIDGALALFATASIYLISDGIFRLRSRN